MIEEMTDAPVLDLGIEEESEEDIILADEYPEDEAKAFRERAVQSRRKKIDQTIGVEPGGEDDLEPALKSSIDRRAASIASQLGANEYATRQKTPDEVEQLYQKVKDLGYTRKYVQDNFDNVSSAHLKRASQETIRQINKSGDPSITRGLNHLAGKGAIRDENEYKEAGKLALILKSVPRGFSSLWQNDDVEEFVESYGGQSPELMTPEEKITRRKEATRISKIFADRRRFQEAIVSRWSEDVKEGNKVGTALNEAWKKGEVSTKEVFDYVAQKLSTTHTLTELFQSLPSSSPSLVAGYFTGGWSALFAGGASGGLFGRDSRIIELMEDNGVNMENPDSILDFLQDGEKVDKLLDKASLYGLGIGVGEGVGSVVGGKITSSVAKRVAGGKIRKALYGLGTRAAGALEEGTTEAGQELFANYISDSSEKNTPRAIIDNFVLGVGSGVALTGSFDLATALINNGERIQQTRKEQEVGKEPGEIEKEAKDIEKLVAKEKESVKKQIETEKQALQEGETVAQIEGEQVVQTEKPDIDPEYQAIENMEQEPIVEPEPLPIEKPSEETVVPETEKGAEAAPEVEGELNKLTPEEVITEAQEATTNVQVLTKFAHLLMGVRGHVGIGESAYKKTIEMGRAKGLGSIDEIFSVFQESFFGKGEHGETLAAPTAIVDRRFYIKKPDGTRDVVSGKVGIERVFSTPEILENVSISKDGPTFGESIELLIDLNRKLEQVFKQLEQTQKQEEAERVKDLKRKFKTAFGSKFPKAIKSVLDWRKKALDPLDRLTGIPRFSDKVFSKIELAKMGQDKLGVYNMPTGDIKLGKKARGAVGLTTAFHEVAHSITANYVRAYLYLKHTPMELNSEQKKFVENMERFEKGMKTIGKQSFPITESLSFLGPVMDMDFSKASRPMKQQVGGKRIINPVEAVMYSQQDFAYHYYPDEVISYMVEIMLATSPTTLVKLPGELMQGFGDRIAMKTLAKTMYKNFFDFDKNQVKAEVVDLFRLLNFIQGNEREMAAPFTEDTLARLDLSRDTAQAGEQSERKTPSALPTRLQVDRKKILRGLKYEVARDKYSPELVITGTDAYGKRVVSKSFERNENPDLAEIIDRGEPQEISEEIAEYADEVDWDEDYLEETYPMLDPVGDTLARKNLPSLPKTETAAANAALRAMIEKYIRNASKRRSEKWLRDYNESVEPASQMTDRNYPVLSSLQEFHKDFIIDPESIKKYQKTIPRNLQIKKADQEGKQTVTIEEAASQLGFKNPVELIKAARVAPDYKTEVERISKAIADKLNGIEPYSVQDLLSNAGYVEPRQERYKNELKMLDSKIPASAREATRKMVRRLSRYDEIKQMAAYMFAKVPVRKITTLAPQFTSEERRQAKLASKEAAKGNFEQAMYHKIEEAVNFEMSQLARKFRERMINQNKRLKRYAKTKLDEANRDRPTLMALKILLSKIGPVAGKVSTKLVTQLNALKKFNPEAYENIVDRASLALDRIVLGDGDMTVVEYESLVDTANALWHQAKELNEVRVDNKRVKKQDVVEKLSGDLKNVKSDKVDRGFIGSIVRGADTYLTVAGTWLQSLDSAMGTNFFDKNIVAPVVDGEKDYIQEYGKMSTEIVDLTKKYLKPQGKEIDNPVRMEAIGHTFKNKLELLGALLHTGSSGNLSRLLIGYGWGKRNSDGTLDRTAWDKGVQELIDNGVLTKADFDFVQSMWDMIESLNPRAQEAFHKINGLYYGEVQAEEITNKFGTYRGGYYPAMASKEALLERKFKEDHRAALTGTQINQILPNTDSSWSKDRVPNTADPLELDPSYARSHIGKILRYIHMQNAVTQANRLLTSPEIAKELQRIRPDVYDEILGPWLSDTVRQKRAEVTNIAVERGVIALKNFVALKIMFLNIGNSVLQFTGLPLAAPRVGALRLMQGFLSTAGGLVGRRKVYEMSPVMEERRNNYMNQVLLELEGFKSRIDERRGFSKIYDYTYVLQAFTQSMVDMAVWQAAYNRGLKDSGGDSQTAIRFADETVIDTQGSSDISRLANIEKTGAVGKVLSMFSRYAIMRYNLIKREIADVKGTEEFSLVKHGPGAFKVLFYTALLPEVLAATMYMLLRGGGDEEEDALEVAVNAGLGATLGLVPIGGNIMKDLLYPALLPGGYRPNIDLSPVQGTLKDSQKFFEEFRKGVEGKSDPVEVLMAFIEVLFPRSITKALKGGTLMSEGKSNDPRSIVTGRKVR